MAIKAGDRLPATDFFVLGEGGPERRATDSVFNGRKIVLFGVPGPFTPTCHRNHLPGYIEHADAIRDKGIDDIAVVAVADPFVMDAWARDTGGKGRITFLSDGNGAFAEATGLMFDGSARGLGSRRLQRFSMVVDDGVVTRLNVEEAPGQVATSGAADLLSGL